MRASVYVRISRDKAGAGLGVARQEADCRAHCDRLGWEVVAVHVDNDMSAYSGKPRPGYTAMLDDLTEGKADAAVAWHPDRLHRSPRELEDFIDLIERTGAKVATVTAGDYDLATPDGRLAARIVGSVARKESEDKSRRLRRKHLELAEQGKASGGGPRPFGFRADYETHDPVEADLIRQAARRVLAGESLWTIRKDWTARKVATSTGAEWSTTALKQLLTAYRTAGLRNHRGKVYPAAWDAIVDEVTWRRLRAVLLDPSRKRMNPPRAYLLSGLVVCGECGERMHATPIRTGKRAYGCLTRKGGCGGVQIRARLLEDEVETQILALLERGGPVEAEERVVGLERVRGAEARLAELDDWFAAGKVGMADWERLRSLVLREAEDAADEVRAAPPMVELADPDEDWPALSVDARRALIGAMVERVEVFRWRGPGRSVAARRVRIVPR